MEDETKTTPTGGCPAADPEPSKTEPTGTAAATTTDPKATVPAAPPVAPESKDDAPSKAELDAFRKWQESQKSEAEKQAAAISKAEKARADAEGRATAAEMKLAAVSKGVKAEAVADVIALAKTKVNDKVTVDQAIDEIIKKYPQFSAAASEPITTGTKTTGGGGNGMTTEDLSKLDYAAYKAYRSGNN